MRFSPLGNTGLTVSQLALGTVELGMDYGFRNSEHYQKPSIDEAIGVVHRALDLGVNIIDTARGYGTSEELVGKAVAGMDERPILASKVAIPRELLGQREALDGTIQASIEASLKALRVESIDILQIHNTSVEILSDDTVLRSLENAQTTGKVRFLGASCVGTAVTEATLETGIVRTLQLPFNLLDRQMLPDVLPRAQQGGIGVMVRSVFLRGVFGNAFQGLPERLFPLKEAVAKVQAAGAEEERRVPDLAMRFCLSFAPVSTLIVGMRTTAEVELNASIVDKGSLSEETLQGIFNIHVEDPKLINPETWQDLI